MSCSSTRQPAPFGREGLDDTGQFRGRCPRRHPRWAHRPGRGRRLRSRDDCRHQRHHAAQRRQDRARDDGRLPRCAGDRTRQPPDMYNLKFHKPKPFVPRRLRFEVRERVGADGSLDAAGDRRPGGRCRFLSGGRVEAIAVCFLHAYAHLHEESAAAAFARAATRCSGHRLVGDHPRMARVRAQQHGRPERLCAAHSGWVSLRPGKQTRTEGLTAPVFAMLERWDGQLRPPATPIALVESGPIAVTGAVSSAASSTTPTSLPWTSGDHSEVLVDRERRSEDHDRLSIGGELAPLGIR